MIYILYAIFTVSASGLTFYLTRRHYYRPSAPLPTQSSSEPITIPSAAITELETPQDGINKLVVALDQNTKSKNQPTRPRSWCGMNEPTNAG